MVSAGEFRNGVTIEIEGNIFQIIEFQHVKPGKGAAFVRTKLKNIIKTIILIICPIIFNSPHFIIFLNIHMP